MGKIRKITKIFVVAILTIILPFEMIFNGINKSIISKAEEVNDYEDSDIQDNSLEDDDYDFSITEDNDSFSEISVQSDTEEENSDNDYLLEAGSMTKCTRDDGVWLFPLESKYWNSFSDYAGCAGTNACLVCGLKHDGSHSFTVNGKKYYDDWDDTVHNAYPNYGVDIGADKGSNVYAARGGYVYFHTSMNSGRGIYAIVEHPIANSNYSYYSLYQHLSKVNNGVHKNGSWVDTRDVVGAVGGSGTSANQYGAHLHFEVFIGEKGGGQALVNSLVDNQTSKYYTNPKSSGYLKTSGIKKGAILTNPKNSNNPGGYGVGGPCGSATWEYHKGSITYTFDKSKVPTSSSGTTRPTVTNVKTSTDSNGATVECDVLNPSGLNSITMTAWVAADGWQNGKYVTYKPTSSSGSHYKFRVNISDLNNKRGAWRSNIFINGEVNYGWFEYTIPEPSNSIPQGIVDVVESTGTNKIHIRGWAYDPDIKSKSLDIHVYVGGSASPSVPCYPIKANKERKDVNKVYGCGDYHGFDETITVNNTGNVSVYIYAIDGNGVNANPLLGSKTITMHTHKYDSGVVTKKATCTSDGVKTFTCSCGNKKTESIPKTGHNWGKWTVTTPATKNANGVETRVCKNDGTHKETRSIPKLKQYIKAKCQMPYQGKGGGWLIGFETYDNPNNSYQYEMLILDCNLYVQGLPAWTYTTGKCGSTGNALWTIWQPQYGYYWTLFRVYDKNGNLLDEECYGFANVF